MPQRVESNTVCLIHGDSLNDDYTIKDVREHGLLISGAALNSGASVFGRTSIRFTGSQYVTFSDISDFAMGTSDFTYEFWLYRDSASVHFPMGDQNGAGTSGSIYFEWESDGTCYVQFFTSTTLTINGSTVMGTGTWHHVAMVRNGSNFYVFLNGTQEGSTQTSSTAMVTSAQGLSLGRSGLWSSYTFSGYINHFRLVKRALYISNFTKPDFAPKGRRGWY